MISVVILTKNEEENIKACIESAKLLIGISGGEIVVVDDFSTDKTRLLANKLGAKVYKRKLNGDFSAQRNFGLKKAQGDWVFFLDADERLTAQLADEIKRKRDQFDGFFVKRQDTFLQKPMKGGEWGSKPILRIAKKGGYWERKVHETWKVDGSIGALSSILPHSSHENLAEFIEKIKIYSSLHAESNLYEGKKPNFIKIIIFPLLKFANNFLFKRGYVDGVHGFIFSVYMSFHSFLSWSQLWLSKEHKT